MSRKETLLKLLTPQYYDLVSNIIDYIDDWSSRYDRSLDVYLVNKISVSGDITEILTVAGFLNNFVFRIELSDKFYSYSNPTFAEDVYYALESNHRSQDILDRSNKSLQYTTLVYEIANILTESQKS